MSLHFQSHIWNTIPTSYYGDISKVWIIFHFLSQWQLLPIQTERWISPVQTQTAIKTWPEVQLLPTLSKIKKKLGLEKHLKQTLGCNSKYSMSVLMFYVFCVCSTNNCGGWRATRSLLQAFNFALLLLPSPDSSSNRYF